MYEYGKLNNQYVGNPQIRVCSQLTETKTLSILTAQPVVFIAVKKEFVTPHTN